MKRATINQRKRRKLDAEESLQKTAQKILSTQLKLKVIGGDSDSKNRKAENSPKSTTLYSDVLDFIPESASYMDSTVPNLSKEIFSEKKRKRDQYELDPSPDQGTNFKVNINDPRLVTEEELRNFIDDHRSEVDLNLLNLDSYAFSNLPVEIQHEIILDLKTKSRQSSWNRLGELIKAAPSALEFSKLQIKNLVVRNDLTERLATISRTAGIVNNPSMKKKHQIQSRRVAAERNLEFVLVKNDAESNSKGVSKLAAGWVMKATKRSNAVDLSAETKISNSQNIIIVDDDGLVPDEISDDDSFSDEDFEEIKFDGPVRRSLSAHEEDEETYLDMNSDMDLEMLQPGTISISDEQNLYSKSDFVQPEIEDETISQILQKFEALQESGPSKPQIHEQFTIGSHKFDFSDNVLSSQRSKSPQPEPKENMFNEMMGSVVNLPMDDFLLNWETLLPCDFHKFLPDCDIREFFSMDSNNLDSEYQAISKRKDKLAVSDSSQNKKYVYEYWAHYLEAVGAWRALHPTFFHDILEVETDVDEDNPIAALPVEQPVDYKIQIDILSQENKNLVSGDSKETPILSPIEIEPMFDNLKFSKPTLSSPVKITNVLTFDDIQEDEPKIVGGKGSPVNFDVEEMGETQTFPESPRNIYPETLFPPEDLSDNENVEIENVVEDNEDFTDVPISINREEDEYLRFVSELQKKSIETVQSELKSELSVLNSQKVKQKRDVGGITSDMISETQELLRLFGLPYIVAPMEAESQCAWLMNNKLVDGIVTDDSDVFLFGGDTVYKNMFNQSRYVECYEMDDIKKEMNLDRKKLIQLAILLGSDYTPGLTGIGSVSAIEIINLWTGDDGLKEFSSWCFEIQKGNVTRKDLEVTKRKFMNLAKKLDIPSGFPENRVTTAYLSPQVDDDLTPMQWGIPDLNAIRFYMGDKLRWDPRKTDEVLLPVIRESNRLYNQQQTTLDKFFSPINPERSILHKSMRVQETLDKVKGMAPKPKPQKKRLSTKKSQVATPGSKRKVVPKRGLPKRKTIAISNKKTRIETPHPDTSDMDDEDNVIVLDSE
ncbi:DNA repair protein rad2 [Nowakowskiella sp. JEL0078]|nr:DNA repair protein rad2 [Nowakowskiella sp. JEL0078]